MDNYMKNKIKSEVSSFLVESGFVEPIVSILQITEDKAQIAAEIGGKKYRFDAVYSLDEYDNPKVSVTDTVLSALGMKQYSIVDVPDCEPSVVWANSKRSALRRYFAVIISNSGGELKVGGQFYNPKAIDMLVDRYEGSAYPIQVSKTAATGKVRVRVGKSDDFEPEGFVLGDLVSIGENVIKIKYEDYPESFTPEELKGYEGDYMSVVGLSDDYEAMTDEADIYGKVDTVTVSGEVITITYLTEASKIAQSPGGLGEGGTDVCVCPKCGKEYPHKRGIACSADMCSACNVALVGKDRPHGRGKGASKKIAEQPTPEVTVEMPGSEQTSVPQSNGLGGEFQQDVLSDSVELDERDVTDEEVSIKNKSLENQISSHIKDKFSAAGLPEEVGNIEIVTTHGCVVTGKYHVYGTDLDNGQFLFTATLDDAGYVKETDINLNFFKGYHHFRQYSIDFGEMGSAKVDGPNAVDAAVVAIIAAKKEFDDISYSGMRVTAHNINTVAQQMVKEGKVSEVKVYDFPNVIDFEIKPWNIKKDKEGKPTSIERIESDDIT